MKCNQRKKSHFSMTIILFRTMGELGYFSTYPFLQTPESAFPRTSSFSHLHRFIEHRYGVIDFKARKQLLCNCDDAALQFALVTAIHVSNEWYILKVGKTRFTFRPFMCRQQRTRAYFQTWDSQPGFLYQL